MRGILISGQKWSEVECSTVQYCTVQYSALQYSTEEYGARCAGVWGQVGR